MVKYVKRLADSPSELNAEELVLYTSAYKNATAHRRTAWRAITNFEMKDQSKNSHYLETIQFYKARIEKELLELCEEVIQTIDNRLLTRTTRPESRVQLLKTRGDYYRYLCEIPKSDKYLECDVQNAEDAVQCAIQL